jgi:hypothetical protein
MTWPRADRSYLGEESLRDYVHIERKEVSF